MLLPLHKYSFFCYTQNNLWVGNWSDASSIGLCDMDMFTLQKRWLEANLKKIPQTVSLINHEFSTKNNMDMEGTHLFLKFFFGVFPMYQASAKAKELNTSDKERGSHISYLALHQNLCTIP